MADETKPLVGVVMGSKSDWETMKHADQMLTRFGVPHECKVMSAHRTPAITTEYASSAEARGVQVLIAAAAAFAEALGADTVIAGFNREEAATFPDNSADFAAAMRAALALGTRAGVAVSSPTQELGKAEIVAEARRLGLAQHDFWSCYGEGPEPCAACESCVRSARAWA